MAPTSAGPGLFISPKVQKALFIIQQAGTGPSRRHIQGSKIAKRLPGVKYSLLQYSKIETFSKKIFRKNYILKNGPSGAPGPASASPWRAKVSQCRKTERRTLWSFSTSILSQKIKKLKGEKIFIFGKNLTVPKKTVKGDPLGFSNIHSDAKLQKKIEGGTIWGKNCFRKKSLAVPKKNERGETLVSPGMVCYAEKQEKPF